MNAKHAWTSLAVVVMAYEIACSEGELLSEGVDKWLAANPILTRSVIAALALHLANALPVRFDLVSLGFLGVRGIRGTWLPAMPQ
jgi:hypothetical protein